MNTVKNDVTFDGFQYILSAEAFQAKESELEVLKAERYALQTDLLNAQEQIRYLDALIQTLHAVRIGTGQALAPAVKADWALASGTPGRTYTGPILITDSTQGMWRQDD